MGISLILNLHGCGNISDMELQSCGGIYDVEL